MSALSTASILSQEGKRVLVLEQHDVVGGNTHTFEDGPKGGGKNEGLYEFDTGLHYIGRGENVKNMMRYITRDGVKWAEMDSMFDVAIAGKDRLAIRGGDVKSNCNDFKGIIEDLKEMFPKKEDHISIDLHFKLVRRVMQLLPFYFVLTRILPSFLQTFFQRCFPSKRYLTLKLFTQTTQQILDSLTDNVKLKGILAYHYGDYGEVPCRGSFIIHAALWDHFQFGAMYPVGGPSVIAQSIVPIIQDAGGAVLVRAPVSSLIFDPQDQGTVIGVEVKGKQIYAPTVISSIGFPQTLGKLIPLSHRHLVEQESKDIEHTDLVSNLSLMSMFIGLKNDTNAQEKVETGTPENSVSNGGLSNGVNLTSSLTKKNYWIFPSWDHSKNWQEYERPQKHDYSSSSSLPTPPAAFISFPSAKDPTYTTRHPNRNVAVVIAPSPYDEVAPYRDERVKHRSKDYEAIKESHKACLLSIFIKEFPHLEDAIDFVDLGTAITNDYYLGTYRGAVYGLAHTPHRFCQAWLSPKLRNVKGLYLTGQDVATVGIVGALMGGIHCAVMMDKSRLVTLGHLLK